MAFTLDQAHALEGSDVYDSRGAFIGTVRGPHVLDGELVGLVVELDDAIAELPTVGRDTVELATDYVEVSGEHSVRLRMDLDNFMDAVVSDRAPPRGR